MKEVLSWASGSVLFMLMAGAAFGDEKKAPWYKVAVAITSVLQGSPGASASENEGIFAPSMSADFELTIWTPESGTAYLLFESGAGEGIDANISTFSGFNGAVDDRFDMRPSQAWYEHAFGEKARLRGGKIDITSDFDTNAVANSETDQFFSGVFINNLATAFPDDNSLGAMLWVAPNDFLDLGFGYADAAAGRENIFNNPFFITELVFKPVIASRLGNYRFYGWYNGKDHERAGAHEDIATDPNYGFGISADQEIAEGVTLFARYGRQRGSISEIAHAWSAGLEISGKIPRREEDWIGLAYGQAIIGKDGKSLALQSGADFGNEHQMELYYKVKATSYLNIFPNMQWVKNPGGDRGITGVWAFGVRACFHINLPRRHL